MYSHFDYFNQKLKTLLNNWKIQKGLYCTQFQIFSPMCRRNNKRKEGDEKKVQTVNHLMYISMQTVALLMVCLLLIYWQSLNCIHTTRRRRRKCASTAKGVRRRRSGKGRRSRVVYFAWKKGPKARPILPDDVLLTGLTSPSKYINTMLTLHIDS